MSEQWIFPIGAHRATLTVVSPEGSHLEPEDMDALFEAGDLFKRQIQRRADAKEAQRARIQPEYNI